MWAITVSFFKRHLPVIVQELNMSLPTVRNFKKKLMRLLSTYLHSPISKLNLYKLVCTHNIRGWLVYSVVLKPVFLHGAPPCSRGFVQQRIFFFKIVWVGNWVLNWVNYICKSKTMSVKYVYNDWVTSDVETVFLIHVHLEKGSFPQHRVSHYWSPNTAT